MLFLYNEIYSDFEFNEIDENIAFSHLLTITLDKTWK
jgi:hypothetical protein